MESVIFWSNKEVQCGFWYGGYKTEAMDTQKELVTRLTSLKKEKDAVIMAHYYVKDEVQDVADYIGDSFYLSQMATKISSRVIVLCGVRFMGESAKVLNPEKKVLLPAPDADCPMAHMASVERIGEVREAYSDVAVVCYVNSTSELKSHSDVCVTSANALSVVKALPNKHIFFIPDENLAHYIAAQVPEKEFIFNSGYCHVHKNIRAEEVRRAKEAMPQAKVLVHPECTGDVVSLADYVGSTSGIINYVGGSEADTFIVATEIGVFHELKKRNPERKFYAAGKLQICPNMKKITLEKIVSVLETEDNEVTLPAAEIESARKPLVRMLELS